MKLSSPSIHGLVADGHLRYTRSPEFRARQQAARDEVRTEFAPRLAAASGWTQRLLLRWQRTRATYRALRRLEPTLHSCFSRVAV